MERDASPRYAGGRNIAIKVPAHQFEDTVRFYRETLRLPVADTRPGTVGFAFGPITLWIDRMAQLGQSEVWLEVNAPDAEAAASDLAAKGVMRCDGIEALPAGFKGFWIAAPGGIVHLLAEPGQ